MVCGPWERDPESTRTVINPSLVVEVLSPSTEAYDRGEKLLHYKRISSLRSVVLIAHDRRELEVWARADEHAPCSRRLYGPTEQAHLPIDDGFELDVDALYDAATEPD